MGATEPKARLCEHFHTARCQQEEATFGGPQLRVGHIHSGFGPERGKKETRNRSDQDLHNASRALETN